MKVVVSPFVKEPSGNREGLVIGFLQPTASHLSRRLPNFTSQSSHLPVEFGNSVAKNYSYWDEKKISKEDHNLCLTAGRFC